LPSPRADRLVAALAWTALAAWGGCDPSRTIFPEDAPVPPRAVALDPGPAPAPAVAPAPAPPPGPFRFVDATAAAGIDFVNASGMTPAKHFPTANGAGVAILDADGDGAMDLLFATATTIPVGAGPPNRNRFYRGRGDGTFADATDASGLGIAGFTHGFVVADLDADDDPDVVACRYGTNVLLRNDGGRFVDATDSSGLGGDGWSSGGAALDIDSDGDLDLYFAEYGAWRLPQDDLTCRGGPRGVRIYCSPRQIRTARHRLYRNEGGLRFTEVGESAGVARDDGHGFAGVAIDLDDDRATDLFVTNDMNPNFTFRGRGDGTFEDATTRTGLAFSGDGQAQSSMGADAEDVNGDGRPDVVVTNNLNEYFTLYLNLGEGSFLDVTSAYGLVARTLPLVGWGCGLVDLDNDGWPDLFAANGRVDDDDGTEARTAGYAQPPLLMRNVAGRFFRDAAAGAGPYFEGQHVGRGVAFGDLDDDGRTDLVVNHKDAPPAVLLNRTPTGENRWVRVKLVGTRSNRDGVGAVVEVRAGDRTIVRHRKSGHGLESSHDPRLLIGVGEVEGPLDLTVRWPGGAETRLSGVAAGTTVVVREPDDAGAAGTSRGAP
jgi:hypothetical protein